MQGATIKISYGCSKNIFEIFSTCYYYTATMVTRTRLNVTLAVAYLVFVSVKATDTAHNERSIAVTGVFRRLASFC